MKLIFCFLLVFHFVGCHLESSSQQVDDFLLRSMSAFSISELYNLEEGSTRKVTSPPNVWMSVARVHYPKNLYDHDDCLFYRSPSKGAQADKKRMGSFKVVRIDSSKKDCQEFAMKESDEKIEGVESLTMSYSFSRIDLIFSLVSTKREEVSIYMFNQREQEAFRAHVTPFEKSLSRGSFYYDLRSKSLSLSKEQAYGSIEDSFSRDQAEVCHQINENCKEVVEYKCERCRYGWYPVVGQVSCPQGHNKYCGQSRCGGSGEPACIRGQIYANQALAKNRETCFTGSEAGFCQRGLETICLDNVLVCQ